VKGIRRRRWDDRQAGGQSLCARRGTYRLAGRPLFPADDEGRASRPPRNSTRTTGNMYLPDSMCLARLGLVAPRRDPRCTTDSKGNVRRRRPTRRCPLRGQLSCRSRHPACAAVRPWLRVRCGPWTWPASRSARPDSTDFSRSFPSAAPARHRAVRSGAVPAARAGRTDDQAAVDTLVAPDPGLAGGPCPACCADPWPQTDPAQRPADGHPALSRNTHCTPRPAAGSGQVPMLADLRPRLNCPLSHAPTARQPRHRLLFRSLSSPACRSDRPRPAIDRTARRPAQVRRTAAAEFLAERAAGPVQLATARGLVLTRCCAAHSVRAAGEISTVQLSTSSTPATLPLFGLSGCSLDARRFGPDYRRDQRRLPRPCVGS